MTLKVHDQNLQLVYSLKLGDGCFVKNSSGERFGTSTYYVQCSSVNLDYISHKKSILDKLGVYTRPISDKGKSGYKKDSKIYYFWTRVHPLITKVGNMSVLEILDNLDIEGLVYFFLDDGTFHQNKHFGHIYCNTFNDEEVEKLIDVMFHFYPQKRCVKRVDRKKDGRQYPYIYIPVVVMNEFKKDVQKFLEDNEIYSLLYKVGGSTGTN